MLKNSLIGLVYFTMFWKYVIFDWFHHWIWRHFELSILFIKKFSIYQDVKRNNWSLHYKKNSFLHQILIFLCIVIFILTLVSLVWSSRPSLNDGVTSFAVYVGIISCDFGIYWHSFTWGFLIFQEFIQFLISQFFYFCKLLFLRGIADHFHQQL